MIFPRVIAGAIITSMEELAAIGDPHWQKARLIKHKTLHGNEVKDDVPIGTMYEVLPIPITWIPAGEPCYLTKDGGWYPVELLELVTNLF